MSHTEISETFSRYTEVQERSIVFAPIISACLSIFGSGSIIYTVLKDRKLGVWRVHERVLLAMSTCDIVSSFNHAMTSIPVPKEVPVFLASGNKSSCVVSAFINQFGLIVAFYNATLCWYFSLVIVKNMSEPQIEKIEWIVHGVPIVLGLLVTIMPLTQNTYRYEGTTRCWIASFPLGCHVNDDIDCIAGENALKIAWLYAGLPMILVLVFVLVIMIRIYVKVHSLEKKHLKNLAKADSGNSNNTVESKNRKVYEDEFDVDEAKIDECVELESKENVNLEVFPKTPMEKTSPEDSVPKTKKVYQSKSRTVAKIASLYVLALFVTFFFTYVRRILNFENINAFFAVHLLDRIFFPTQGIFNYFVFMYRRKLS